MTTKEKKTDNTQEYSLNVNVSPEILMQKAREAKARAYAPYSHFPVGAALLMKDGKIYSGVNIENASFGATNCAERSAMFTAISDGYQKGDFKAIAIAGDTDSFLPPCNICRQVLVEFCSPKMPVYLTKEDESIKKLLLEDLSPYAFVTLDM
ncbi:MAG: cytidine deaminase [Bavariicoccus seileri]|uniref:cytidine deaminase n=1 Tax=Bavariicoccus seileri TaxID=549685 RepID=UPI003F9CAD68